MSVDKARMILPCQLMTNNNDIKIDIYLFNCWYNISIADY